jgi:hypothetical protein
MSGTPLMSVYAESIGLTPGDLNQGIVIYCRPAWDQGNCSIVFTDESGRKELRFYTIELSYTFPTKEWRQPDLDQNETSEPTSSSPWTA